MHPFTVFASVFFIHPFILNFIAASFAYFRIDTRCTLPKTSKVKTRLYHHLMATKTTLFAASFTTSSNFIPTTTVPLAETFPPTLCMLSSLVNTSVVAAGTTSFVASRHVQEKNEHRASITTKQVVYPFAIHLLTCRVVSCETESFQLRFGYRKQLA